MVPYRLLISALVPLLACFGQNASPTCQVKVPFSIYGDTTGTDFRLDPARLQVKLNGREVQPISITQAPVSRTSVLLDVSGSMRWVRAPIVRMTRNLVEAVPPTTIFYFGTFAEDLRLVPGKEAAMAALQKLNEAKLEEAIKGRTDFATSLTKAVEEADLQRGDLLLVISDTGGNRGGISISQLKKRLAERSIRASFLIPYNAMPGSLEEAQGPMEASAMADYSGGVAVYLWKTDPTKTMIDQQFLRELFQVHWLELTIPSDGEAKLQVKVRKPQNKQQPNLQVSAPPKIGCAAHP